MQIKQIHAQLSIPKETQEDVDYVYNFFKKSRHIFNYINRECLKRKKVESDQFNTIGIGLGLEDRDPYIINKTLFIPLVFNRRDYDSLSSETQFREFIKNIVVHAAEKTEGKFRLLFDDILDCFQTLKDNNFVNKWRYKRKVDKALGLEIELNCQLTISHFLLNLIISLKGKVVFSDKILKTDPDEVAYHYRFKDIIIQDNQVIITSKYGDNLFEFDLGSNVPV